MGKMNFFDAALAFSKVKGQKRFKNLYDLCIQLEKEGPEAIPDLAITLRSMGERVIIPVLMATWNNKNTIEEKILGVRKIYDSIHNHVKSPKPILSSDCTSLSFTQGNKWEIRHLNYFFNFPLVNIDLKNSAITDMKAIASMPVKKLNIANTPIASLQFLSETALEELDISNTKVGDIKVISSLPLKVLNISFSKVKNFNPLIELNGLETLIISKNQEQKIKFLDLLRSKNINVIVVAE